MSQKYNIKAGGVSACTLTKTAGVASPTGKASMLGGLIYNGSEIFCLTKLFCNYLPVVFSHKLFTTVIDNKYKK